jgi:hypothetical protein
VTSLPVGTARPAVIALVAGAAVGLTSLFAVRFLPQPANLLGTLGSSLDARRPGRHTVEAARSAMRT